MTHIIDSGIQSQSYSKHGFTLYRNIDSVYHNIIIIQGVA